MKFCGNFKGKYWKTTVEGGKITNTEGCATLSISKVGKGAYLITVVDDGSNTFNDLAYLEGDVLRAQAQSGEGVTSTYFEDGCLIHQLSNKSPTVWTVKNYKFKPCKC